MKGMVFRLPIFLMSVFVGLWLAGCDNPEPIPLEKTPEEEALRSGGLGLHLPAFEILHGKTERCGKDPCLKEGKESVSLDFAETSPEERIIRFLFRFNDSADLAKMRETVRAFLPTDSRLVRTYSVERGLETIETPGDLPVDLYHSAWLEQRLPESAWRFTLRDGVSEKRTKPGIFYVQYKTGGAYVVLGKRERE